MALGSLVAQLAIGGFGSISETLKCKKLEKKFNAGSIDFEEMSLLGGYYLKKKDFIKAEFFSKKLLELSPNNNAVLNSLFEIYYFSNNYVRAIEVVESLIKEGKDLPIHFFNLGYCYFKMGNLDKSQEYKDKAVELDSSFKNEKYK